MLKPEQSALAMKETPLHIPGEHRPTLQSQSLPLKTHRLPHQAYPSKATEVQERKNREVRRLQNHTSPKSLQLALVVRD